MNDDRHIELLRRVVHASRSRYSQRLIEEIAEELAPKIRAMPSALHEAALRKAALLASRGGAVYE
jgi:hypothetical protein